MIMPKLWDVKSIPVWDGHLMMTMMTISEVVQKTHKLSGCCKKCNSGGDGVNEELHKCNCGGNAVILSEWDKSKPYSTKINYWIMCDKCGIITQKFHDDKEKAILSWNIAMGHFQTTKNIRCSNGHLVPDGQYFCPVCGERIDWSDNE